MIKEFKTEFTEKNLTGNAGLIHFGRFVKKLYLKEMLTKHIRISRASNADYQIANAIIMLMMGVLAGVKHMSHMGILKVDKVICSLFNWDRFPVSSTFGRLFKLFNHASCNELADVENIIRRKVWKKRWFGRVTLDFDSTVRGVFGYQEGAEVGYNPDKKGQKSYHPLFCFIAETRECLHNWFRPGNAYSANGIVDFASECFARLPKGVWKVFVRADSAFFNGIFLDLLESRGALYLIKVKMKNLITLLSGKRWKQIKNMPGFESTEFEYQCADWKRARHFVAIRKLTKVVTEGLLFPSYEYDYFCYVTNERLTPLTAHKRYGKRATSENWIEWCKNQMAAGSILTDDFWANSAIFQTCIMAYNIMAWMMWLTCGHKINEEPNTIRYWLVHVPARLLTSSRQFVLKLSKNWYFKNRWIEMENSIEQLSFI